MSILAGRAGRIAAMVAMAAAFAAGAGCRAAVQTGAAPAPGMPLVIVNHDYFDVGVYVQPADGSQGFRIATVNGFSSARVTVRRELLERGSTLTVQVHAIGTAYSWTSPSTLIDSDDVARLDVFSDANGDLHRCAFYARAW